ncbi:MAG: hypothetical protein ABIT38_11180, partial [Gemmatimonadaceae bacterium]
AIALLERALFAGAHLRADETMLVVDRYWAQGEFSALPNAAIALLVGDPHLFESKFYQRHNAGPAGSGWIDRSFREALAITDDVVLSISGRTPRDLAIARHGRTEVGRAAFAGAVYDFGRKSAVLGTITSLPHAAPVANTYRNALRFVEDILRRSKGFPMEMSGAPLRRELATALSEHFATWAKGSRESSTPTENAAPVTELAALVATLVKEAESPPPAVEDVTPKTPIAADDVSDAAHRMMAFFEQPPLPGVMSEAPFGDGAPDDFGPVELEVLRVISREPTDVRRYDNPKALLREIANRHATTPWLLIHRVNQVARRTPFGNRVIDINADPPRIHEQAKRFVDEIIARMKK